VGFVFSAIHLIFELVLLVAIGYILYRILRKA
jgi:hypothetical protein